MPGTSALQLPWNSVPEIQIWGTYVQKQSEYACAEIAVEFAENR